jgi:DNA-binding CsgD family transcriptional regulator
VRNAWPLAGRAQELCILDALVRSRAAGGVVVTGGAGTGKTRLGVEALRIAAEHGRATARIAASRAAATIPLGAFAALLPPPTGGVAPALTHASLHEAGGALRRLGGDAPLVLLADDAHLLDEASAALLLQVVVDGSVLAVVTVPTGERPPDPVLALWKDGHCRRLDLEPLSPGDSAAVVSGALGGEVDGASGRRIWEASRGNPLYLEELVLGAVESGLLEDIDGVWVLRGPLRAPPALRDLLASRLDGLPATCGRLLAILAVADGLGLATASALEGGRELAGLERRGFVEVARDGRRRTVRLAHPLYADVLREGVPESEAADLAGVLARLAAGTPRRRVEDVLRLATLHVEAGVAVASDVLALAGAQAYAAGRFELAERLARATLRQAPPGDARTDTALLFGQLLHEQGRHDEAEGVLGDLDGRSATLEGPQRARAALQRAVNLFFGLGREAQASAVLRRAERGLRSTEAAVLVANRAWLALVAGRPAAGLRLARTLGTAGEGEVRLLAAVTAAWALAAAGRPRAALEAATQGSELVEDSSRPKLNRFRDFPDLPRALALLETGDLAVAGDVIASGHERSLRGHPTFIQSWWLFLGGRLALVQGRPRSAAGWFRQAAALQRTLHQPGLLRWQLAGLALAAVTAGDAEAAMRALAEHDALGARPERLFEPTAGRARAWVAAVTGEQSAAVAMAASAASTARALGLGAEEAAALHDVVRLGAPAGAADRLAVLARRAGPGLTAMRAEHAAAQAAGDAGALARAAAGLERAGALLPAADAFAAAASAARPCERLVQDCTRRGRTLAARCEGARTPMLRTLGDVQRLTRREHEVTTLAAGGMASKEIARRLVVSVRTVDNLLQRSYRKLGVSSRAAAREVLARERDAPSTSFK